MAPDQSKDAVTISEDTEITNEYQGVGLKHVLAAELKDLASTGMALRQKINTAKTSHKKKYYTKKYQKNSKRAAEVIMALERLQIAEQQRKHKQQQEFIDVRDADAIDRGRASEENDDT